MLQSHRKTNNDSLLRDTTVNSDEAEHASEPALRWDRKYAAGGGPAHFRPNPLLVEHQHLLGGGRALDVACGFGGNALLLAGSGYQVEAVDASRVALGRAQAEARRRRLDVTFVQADLERWWLPPERYDLACMFFYLDRELVPRLAASLRPGGLWFLAQRNSGYLEVRSVFDPAYLLQPGELPDLAHRAGLQVLYHSEEMAWDPYVAGIIAVKPGR